MVKPYMNSSEPPKYIRIQQRFIMALTKTGLDWIEFYFSDVHSTR